MRRPGDAVPVPVPRGPARLKCAPQRLEALGELVGAVIPDGPGRPCEEFLPRCCLWESDDVTDVGDPAHVGHQSVEAKGDATVGRASAPESLACARKVSGSGWFNSGSKKVLKGSLEEMPEAGLDPLLG